MAAVALSLRLVEIIRGFNGLAACIQAASPPASETA